MSAAAAKIRLVACERSLTMLTIGAESGDADNTDKTAADRAGTGVKGAPGAGIIRKIRKFDLDQNSLTDRSVNCRKAANS
ncbi:MAG TPA: hypothetical protein PKM48_12080, partial [Parvularculaceae bacterium]|nr:hypothetical protein [Parvularculaceae bacterium]